MAQLILIALLGAAGWVISLYLFPYAPCIRCEGSGRNPGSNRARYGQCRRCLGTGRRQRRGARVVHRGRVSLAERMRDRKGL